MIRRRKWVILLVVLLTPASAVWLSLRQEPLYEASAEVLLRHENLAASLTGLDDATFSQNPVRLTDTQAELARVPAIAERVLQANGITAMTPDEFLGASDVSANPDADLLEFSVTDPNPGLAARLATAYARHYTLYRLELDTAAFSRALRDAEAGLAELEAAGQEKSPLYVSLVDKAQILRTAEALQTSNAFLVRPATEGGQVSPQPLRNGALALVLGLLLGIGLAFLWEALDTRLRSAEEIGAALGLPLLARLPEPPRRLRSKERLVTIDEPRSAEAEAFRVLRTNLDFVNLERKARSVLVTSAVEEEGKSTTIANLAVTLARTGRRVVLVDLDLRRPILHRFFALEQRPGVTDVALGQVALDDALQRIAIVDPGDGAPAEGNGGGSAVEGFLEILPTGPLPPDPGEFVATSALADILRQLRERADFVLVDSPPLFHVSDALAISAKVDALLLVARLNVLRRPMLRELRRLLAACPAVSVGFVTTGADGEEGYGYGYGRYRAYHPSLKEPVA